MGTERRTIQLPRQFQSPEPNSSDYPVLGKGTEGCVIKALYRPKTDGKFSAVAVKMVDISKSNGHQSTSKFYKNLLREIQILDNIKHPQLCRCKQKFIMDSSNMLCLVFEYMQYDLKGFLCSERTLNIDALPPITPRSFCQSVDNVRLIAVSILRAVDYIHSNGVFHRDIKPSNIGVSLNEDGTLTVKLFDVGIARCLDSQEDEFTAAVGTPLYMAPELLLQKMQLLQRKTVTATYDSKVDIWSTGMVIMELLGYIDEKKSLRIHPPAGMKFKTEMETYSFLMDRIFEEFHPEGSSAIKNVEDELKSLEESLGWTSLARSQVASLLERMVQIDKSSRFSAKDCLDDSFLKNSAQTMQKQYLKQDPYNYRERVWKTVEHVKET